MAVLWLAPSAQAGETQDQSLAKEVERYLESTQVQGADDPRTFRVFWDKTIKFETSDGAFKVKLGGRLMWDSFWQSSDDLDAEDTQDSTFFRRIRLAVSGTVYQHVTFKVQLDFAGQKEVADEDTDDGSGGTTTVGSVALRDVYVGLKQVGPVNEFRFGHFFEPFGLEEQTSSKYITLMERSAPGNAFAPARNDGMMAHTTFREQRNVYVALGVFRTTDDQGRRMDNNGYAFTFRIASWLLEDTDRKRILHLGFAYRYNSDDRVRFRTRPGTGKGSRFVDTGTITADSTSLFGFEIALVWQRFHFAAEYFMADVDPVSGSSLTFSGFYFEIGFWITGETRKYDKKKFLFGRTSPKQNLKDNGGKGGWQVAYRFDSTDLTDGAIDGGTQDTHTIGVNWHWNPNARVMFNYVIANVENGVDIDIHTFQMRFQFDF